MLFELGAIDEADVLDDVTRMLRDAPHRAGDEAIEAIEAASDPSRTAYARGAMLAASLDARIRRRSHGARSLGDVVRALAASSPDGGGVGDRSIDELGALLARELGPSAEEELGAFASDPSAPVALPDDAFGPCFERKRVKETRYELGLDPRALDRVPALVHGLVQGSAAERAGLREGVLVVASRVPSERDPKHAVELTIASAHGARKIRYLPKRTHTVERWRARRCR
jgi:predicted metalloprotease with PDZ domain